VLFMLRLMVASAFFAVCLGCSAESALVDTPTPIVEPTAAPTNTPMPTATPNIEATITARAETHVQATMVAATPRPTSAGQKACQQYAELVSAVWAGVVTWRETRVHMQRIYDIARDAEPDIRDASTKMLSSATNYESVATTDWSNATGSMFAACMKNRHPMTFDPR
jgi:hypothetical protein